MSEKSYIGTSTEGNPAVSLKDADQATRGMISAGVMIGSIFTKTVYIGVITPFLFAYLGSSNVLVTATIRTLSRLRPVAKIRRRRSSRLARTNSFSSSLAQETG